MTALRKQKGPAALEGRRPGAKLRDIGSYPVQVDLQAAGERFALQWRETAERFASAFFHALADDNGPAIRAVLHEAIEHDLQLWPEHFPTPEHWTLVRILCGFAEAREWPTIDGILEIARNEQSALPIGGGDERAELRAVLDHHSSAALLLHHGTMLRKIARRREHALRRWRRLILFIDNPFGDARRSSTPIIVRRSARRFSPRAIARVLEGASA